MKGVCEYCGLLVEFATSLYFPGDVLVLDRQPHRLGWVRYDPAKHVYTVLLPPTIADRVIRRGAELYVPHAATCKQAERWALGSERVLRGVRPATKSSSGRSTTSRTRRSSLSLGRRSAKIPPA